MLQFGFGLTPFESGSLTFAAAAGSLMMKFTAPTALRWFGFRPTLVVNGLISGAFLASCALFTPSTPHWLIFAALLVGGFFRSLQFTALNAVSYADIDGPRMSRATSFASVSQQTSSAVGIAVAALCVELIQLGYGDATLGTRDLSLAFVMVALLSSLSVFIFARLEPDAGAAVSGRSRPARSARPRRRSERGPIARSAARRTDQAPDSSFFLTMRAAAAWSLGDQAELAFDFRLVDPVGIVAVQPRLPVGMVRMRGIGRRVEHLVETGDAAAIFRRPVAFAGDVMGIGKLGIARPDLGDREPALPAVAEVVEVIDHRLARPEYVSEPRLTRVGGRLVSKILIRRFAITALGDGEFPKMIGLPAHGGLDDLVQRLESA